MDLKLPYELLARNNPRGFLATRKIYMLVLLMSSIASNYYPVTVI